MVPMALSQQNGTLKMTSPICLVNGNPTTNGVDVTKNTTITVQLADLAGVNTWEITCIGTDDILTTDDINDTLEIIDVNNKTATFTMPNGDGYSVILQSKVNQGVDVNGRAVAAYTTTFKISTLINGNRTIAANETIEGSALYGWAQQINNIIRSPFVGTFTTATSASAGSNGAVPAQVAGYIVVNINGTNRKIPFFS